MSEIEIRSPRVPDEYPRLVEIWRSAVDATHDFLADEHRDAIEGQLAAAYFPAVDLVVAERGGTVVGFAGTHAGALEMLFVAADARGSGVGGALLSHALTKLRVDRVDVNEQNPQAVGFYERHGFVVTGRDALDAEGLPYPILHMSFMQDM